MSWSRSASTSARSASTSAWQQVRARGRAKVEVRVRVRARAGVRARARPGLGPGLGLARLQRRVPPCESVHGLRFRQGLDGRGRAHVALRLFRLEPPRALRAELRLRTHLVRVRGRLRLRVMVRFELRLHTSLRRRGRLGAVGGALELGLQGRDSRLKP